MYTTSPSLLHRAHYPGTNSDSDAMKTDKQLWASEDYSTYNDEVGTGCWARVSIYSYMYNCQNFHLLYVM